MKRVNIEHDCNLPDRELPSDVKRIEEKWHCPECGAAWYLSFVHGGLSAQRNLFPGVKNWFWQMRNRRRILDDDVG